MNEVAFITPTKDRPGDLRKMLASLAAQTQRPDQVIVVDASVESTDEIVRSVEGLSVDYLRWTDKPSAAAQRNGGLSEVRDDIDLVCFFDDDQILHPDGIEKMVAFWQTAPEDLGGASFNMANHKDNRPARLKRSWLSNALGLYCIEPGKVAPSGWQSLYGKVTQNTEVEWLSSQAIVLHRKAFDEFRFDPFFGGYSYLEDLDFSYSVSRKYKLVVVENACFEHHPCPAGRTSSYRFGEVESRNRLYFVRKHKLSTWRCYLGLLIRGVMTLKEAVMARNVHSLGRALGNIDGIFWDNKELSS